MKDPYAYAFPEIHILISCIQDWDSKFEMLIRVKRKKADDDARKIKGIVSADMANLYEPAQLFRQLVANTLNQERVCSPAMDDNDRASRSEDEALECRQSETKRLLRARKVPLNYSECSSIMHKGETKNCDTSIS